MSGSRSHQKPRPINPVAIAVLKKTDTDAKGKGNQKTSKDSAIDPWYDYAKKYSKDGNVYDRVGQLIVAERMIPPVELYAASFTPKGHFVTQVAPRNALRFNWKFVKEKKSKEPLDLELHNLIIQTVKRYQLKKKCISAVQVAEKFGRALLFRVSTSPKGKVKEFQIRICRCPDEWVDYDQTTNIIKSYRPIVGWGLGVLPVDIKPEDAVMFIADEDPEGNSHHGIPALVAPYRTIVRSENVSESWSDTVGKRGLGLVDLTIQGVETKEELQPWANEYGDINSYSVIVHNEKMEVKAVEGMKASFSLDETMERYTKEVSSTTGYPTMRMEGVQTGAVTGSETDQDNMAENYSSLQERYEQYILDTIRMLEPKLKDKDFEIEWEFDIKMDRAKLAQVFSTFASSIMLVQDLITMNQALDMLGFPAIPEPDGNKTVADYIAEKGFIRGQGKPIDTYEKPYNQFVPNELAPEEREIQEPSQEKPSPPTEKEPGIGAESFDSFEDWLTEMYQVVKSRLDPRMKEKFIIDGLKQFNVTPDQKDNIAELLSRAGDSLERLSYPAINRILKAVCKKGCSFTDLSKFRK